MIKFSEWASGQLFKLVHRSNLVYNTCWEDPRLDRIALQLSPSDCLVMITSAGCNALDYALLEPKEIHAIDVNFRQNALLDLKIAGIRQLDFDDFFEVFGLGRSPKFPHLYRSALRSQLNPVAKSYWDKRLEFFSGVRKSESFYFKGTAGTFARMINRYIDRKPQLRETLDQMFHASSLDEQSALYYSIRPQFWSRLMRWILGRDSTMALLGVPRSQRLHVEQHYPGGIAKFIEDCVDTVFAKLPLKDNYFWRLYVYGQYTLDCCPEYLRENNFHRLKNGLINSVHSHTTTVAEFLADFPHQVSKFVLLDHMDWMNCPSRAHLLAAEWQTIVDRAAANSRIIWRSGGLDGRFVDTIQVRYQEELKSLGDMLIYHSEQAAALHARDRVHTYGSFCIADLKSTA